MIVRQFLHWLRTAPAGERAEATSALARAYLYSDLSDNDRAAAEGAMIMLLDDPSPLVRRALAEVFAGSRGCAADGRACARQRSAGRRRAGAAALAAVPRRRSGRGGRDRRAGAAGRDRRARASAVLGRPPRSPRSAAPRPAWCCWKTRDAEIVPFSLDRIVERFGHLAAIRDVLLARDDLPAPTRQALVVKLSRDARRLRHRARMARRRPRPPRSPGRPARRRPSRSPPNRRTARCAR